MFQQNVEYFEEQNITFAIIQMRNISLRKKLIEFYKQLIKFE